MAEFDYEVVDGRKIRVRPQEVVSEILYFPTGSESCYFWMSRHLHWIRSLSEKFWIRSKKRQMKDIQCFWCPMR